MKNLTLFACLLFLTACESQPTTETTSPRELPAIGNYRHHQGEINRGTITIHPERIRIDTDQLNMDIDTLRFHADSIQVKPDCWILVRLSAKNLKISITGDQISVWLMDKNQTELYYGDPGYYGTFDRVTTQPAITEPEPVTNN